MDPLSRTLDHPLDQSPVDDPTTAGPADPAGARRREADRTDRAHRAAGLSTLRTAVICLALLLEGMSSSSINVQVHAIQADLAVPASVLQLAVGAFLLAYAGLLPLAGQLVDRSDRRTVFLTGVALFGVGCLVCAGSTGPWSLVGGRVIQGAGAALSAPAALALITHGHSEGAHRNRAVAIYGAMGAAGFSLGLVLPGFVVARAGWRVSFLVLVPVVFAVLLATKGIRRTARQLPAARIDLVGSLLLTVALVTAVHLVGAVGSASRDQLLIEAALVLTVGAVITARRGIAGYPVQVLRSRPVVAAALSLAGIFAGVLSSMYVLSLGLQLRSGLDAFTLGLLVLPQPVCFSLSAGLGARLVGRWGPWPVLGLGAFVLAASLTLLGTVDPSTAVWLGVLPAMAGVGLSLGLAFPAASIAVVDAVADEHRGTGAALLTTAQNIGGALGVAVLTALALVPAPHNRVTGGAGMFVALEMVLLAVVCAGAILTRRAGTAGTSRWPRRSRRG